METEASALATPGTPTQRVPWPEAWGAIVCLSAAAATIGAVTRFTGAGGLFLPTLCLGVMILAAGFDAATNRIPNALTYTAVLVGLGVNCLDVLVRHAAPHVASRWLGAAGPTQSVVGLLLFGGIGLVGVVFAGMGGGDMKLLGAIGAMLGLSRASDGLLVGAGVAVLYSLVNLLIAGRLNGTLRSAAAQFLNLIYLREWQPLDGPQSAGLRRTIPLAIPLMAGIILVRIPAIAGAVAWLTHTS